MMGWRLREIYAQNTQIVLSLYVLSTGGISRGRLHEWDSSHGGVSASSWPNILQQALLGKF